jgi:uncharacterized protein (TIGR03435 family)
MIRTILGISLSAVCAWAQNPPAAAPLAFEAASVKPAPPPTGRGMRVMMGGDPGRVNFTNVSLRDIIRQAYKLKDYQITGPEWINNERFDVTAKLPEGAKETDKPEMLRTLLAERFKLTVHRETKELPAYALVVAKGGPKMKEFVETPPDGSGGPNGGRGMDDMPPLPKMGPDGMPKMPAGGRGGMMMMSGMGKLQGNGIALSSLADILTRQLDRPVLDETGLTAKYDITLNWTPEPGEGPAGMKMRAEGGGGGGPDGHLEMPEPSGPPLAIALQQQLGLRLEPKRLPLEMVVVDRVEKVPTEN